MLSIIEQFGIKWELVAAETVNFLIVLAILYFFVFKKITNFLYEREEKIRDGIANAERAEELLADAASKKEAIITAAEQEASELISASVQKAKDKETEILAKASDKADIVLATAKEKGETEKQKIIDSSKEEIAELITLGASKILASK